MERNVVVAGWGQVTQPKILSTPAKDPMGLMALAANRAAEQTGSKKTLSRVDGVMVVRTLSRHYTSPADELAAMIGASPRFTHVSGIGGNSPQTLVNIAAGMIARNELDSVLVAGAEAYVQRDPESQKVENALFMGIPEDYPEDDINGTLAIETIHGIGHPVQGFPLYETALWAASGMDLDAYLKKVADFWAGFSRTASNHPYAWSKTARTPSEILTAGPNNRPIAFPYTKFMTSFVTVDQGAAILLMAEDAVPKSAQKDRRPVYFLGGGYAEDRQRFMVEKSDFTASPPLKAAVEKALDRSGVPLDEIECFDLYSCFPCAVTIARKMIGIKEEDSRPLTLTGGLGFFGGPGNNYNLHAIATLAESIATGKRGNGLVTALGWFMHKHAAGVYSAEPGQGEFRDHDIEDQKNRLAGDPPVPIQKEAAGTGIIETYTIVYTTDRQPAYAVLYGKTDNNFRFIARTMDDQEVFRALTSKNCVGQKVTLSFDSSQNLNRAELS